MSEATLVDTVHVVALFDPPSPKSFGKVPFLERLADGGGQVHGFRATPGPLLTEQEHTTAVVEGSVRPVDVLAVRPDGPLIAGWIGTEFIRNVAALQAPVPLVSTDAFYVGKLGFVWIDTHAAVEATLTQWTSEAARVAFRTRSLALARLMVWAQPESLESSAALWFTMPTPSLQARELAWQTKLRRDAGDTLLTEAELEQRFRTVRDLHLMVP